MFYLTRFSRIEIQNNSSLRMNAVKHLSIDFRRNRDKKNLKPEITFEEVELVVICSSFCVCTKGVVVMVSYRACAYVMRKEREKYVAQQDINDKHHER